MRSLLRFALAVALLSGIAGWQPAQAGCFWNGVHWECWHHPRYDGWWRLPHFWVSGQGGGGPLWRFYGWERK